MIAILKPLTGVGDFVFNDSIENYKSTYDFDYSEMGGYEYEVYSIKDPDISLYVEEGRIGSINCFEECLYKGSNIPIKWGIHMTVSILLGQVH